MKKIKWLVLGLTISIVISLASVGVAVYTYSSIPARVSEYINQHKIELKGAKGDKGATGAPGANGISGSLGSGGTGGGLNCTTYGINNQYTSCY